MVYKNKILLVDDDDEILSIYGDLLKNLPSKPEVYTASSGKLAISLLDNNAFDLLICDIKMPEMDGLQVISVVRRRFPDLRIIILTSLPDESYRDRAYRLGVDMYWQKPSTKKEIEMFLDCVESMLYQSKKGGFRGMQVKNLVDIIQLECMCGNSTTLKVTSGSVKASIFIKDGEIIDAEIGDLRGEIAFKKILKLKSGGFEFLPLPQNRERTIFASYNGLLLDAAQTIDEIQTDDRSQLPDASEVGDRTALEKPIIVIGKSDGVNFVIEGDIEHSRILDTCGVGNFDPYHSWIMSAIKAWNKFGDSFSLGHLQQIQAFNPHDSLFIEQFHNKYLCVGFNSDLPRDSLQEQMKKNVAIWLS